MKTLILITAICFQVLAGTVVSMDVVDTVGNKIHCRLIQTFGGPFDTMYTWIPLNYPGVSNVENPRKLGYVIIHQDENEIPIYIAYYGDSGSYDEAMFKVSGAVITVIPYYPSTAINPIVKREMVFDKKRPSFEFSLNGRLIGKEKSGLYIISGNKKIIVR